MANKNVKNIKVSSTESFFIYYLQFLKPYHKLRNKEIEMLAYFLAKRNELSNKIKDDSLVDKVLFSKNIKDEIRDKMNYSNRQVFDNMLYALRQKNVIVDGRINKGLIPQLTGDKKGFQLIFNFIIENETG